MKKNFILGFISGGIICATVTGFAVEYAITPNPYPVTVNGTEQQIEGYNINDNTYFKLRDIADVVGGFTVDFVNDTISLTSKTQTSNVDNVNGEDSSANPALQSNGKYTPPENMINDITHTYIQLINNIYYITPAGMDYITYNKFGVNVLGWYNDTQEIAFGFIVEKENPWDPSLDIEIYREKIPVLPNESRYGVSYDYFIDSMLPNIENAVISIQ